MHTISMHTFTRNLMLLVYFAIVLIPVGLLGYDGPWLGAGNISIRDRAPFPEKFAPGAYGMFDEWFADRVGLRFPLIYIGTELHIGILRRPLDRHIFFGRDDWMFWTDDGETLPAPMADSRGRLRFTPLEVSRIDAELILIKNRFEACGIPAGVVVAPNKQSIYGEYLINTEGGMPPTRLDALLDKLSEPAKSMMIDLRPKMRGAKSFHGPVRLYNKTETHWNGLGAYYGYLGIMAQLERKTPTVNRELMSLDQFQITATRYAGGDMANRVLFSPWRFPDEDVSVKPFNRAPFSGEIRIDRSHLVARNPNGKGKLILFGDSFAEALVPFLWQHFAEVHRYIDVKFDGSAIASHRPDAVLLLMVERHANRLLQPQVNMSQACEK